jgi:hypothetical protein
MGVHPSHLLFLGEVGSTFFFFFLKKKGEVGSGDGRPTSPTFGEQRWHYKQVNKNPPILSPIKRWQFFWRLFSVTYRLRLPIAK